LPKSICIDFYEETHSSGNLTLNRVYTPALQVAG
jgi:hypothetical protein